MKLKLDESGNAVLKDGMPVYIRDDGTEAPIDVAGMARTIKDRNAEAKANRERAEAAEAVAKQFEGIDPAKAREAVSVVQNLNDKKLVDAGEVERIKLDVRKTMQAEIDARDAKIKDVEDRYFSEVVGGAFARSKYLTEHTTLPSDLAQAAFGKNFKIENGQLRGYDAHGNVISSKKNPGDPAGFDEAIESLIGNYQHRDSILKSPQGSGSGAPSGGGGGGGKKQITRTEFEAMDTNGRSAFMKDKGVVVDG